MNRSGESIRVVHPLFQVEGSGSNPTSPLQLHVGKIHWKIASGLNELWHSRFPLVPKPETHNPCFGAEFEGLFYASAMWGMPIAANRLRDGFNRLELRRFAISPDAPKFTASRMLGIMIKMIKKDYPLITGLLSYQDMEAHSGTIYKACGWKSAGVSKNSSWIRSDRKSSDEFVQSVSPKTRWEIQI